MKYCQFEENCMRCERGYVCLPSCIPNSYSLVGTKSYKALTLAGGIVCFCGGERLGYKGGKLRIRGLVLSHLEAQNRKEAREGKYCFVYQRRCVAGASSLHSTPTQDSYLHKHTQHSSA